VNSAGSEFLQPGSRPGPAAYDFEGEGTGEA